MSLFAGACPSLEYKFSLGENDIDRYVSLGENDIDRDISLAQNDIDRGGQQQDKSKIKYFFYSQNLSASAEIPSL